MSRASGAREAVQDRAARCAQLLLDAYASGRQFVAKDDDGPADVAEAYRVQDIVLDSLDAGRRPSAWKVIPPQKGSEPFASPVPSARVLHSPAQVSAARFHMIGVESEIAFRVGRDLPPRATPYREDEVAHAIDEALVLIELVDTRLANWNDASALWKLADFQSNGAFVLGSGRRDWRRLDFRAQRCELWVDGAKRLERTGTHASGNPFSLMPWMAMHCALRCGGLRAGDVVTTGSWTGLEFLEPGAEALVRFPGIGEARVRIER